MVRWGETFWGEGNRGFEVLSTNVKNGGIAIDEFQRFLTERFGFFDEKKIDFFLVDLVYKVKQPIVVN